MNERNFEDLRKQLEQLALPVGFKSKGVPQNVDEVPPPPNAWAWESCFALLVLVAVPEVTSARLVSIMNQAHHWMWERLNKEEVSGRLLDGYLLLALSEPPNESLRPVVQEIAMNTQVCRKHVLSPSTNGWQEQLWAVTCVGLPPKGADVGHAPEPNIPATAIHALQLYQESRNYELAAEALRAEARVSAETEDSCAS